MMLESRPVMLESRATMTMNTHKRWGALSLSLVLLVAGSVSCASSPVEPSTTPAEPCPTLPSTGPADLSAPSSPPATAAPPALPSWRDGAAKQRIQAFVRDVTDPASANYLEPASRIAVFDNDGTLWSEQPIYFQFAFAIDRVTKLLAGNPPWASKPWAQKLKKDGAKAIAHLDEKSLLEIVGLSEAGVSTEEFRQLAHAWLSEARHPRFGRPYTQLTFLPMRELVGLLRQNQFKIFIVSGGSVQFMRAFAEEVYGIPPEQVIGSYMATHYEIVNGRSVLVSEPQLAFLDDGSGKPVAIDRIIGRRPVFVAGNSDGDREMLEYGTSGPGPSLGLIVHHDDEAREWAYDRTSHVGKLDKAWDQAASRNWLVVSVKDDFAEVYAPASAP